VTNISKSFTYKMAAKINWRRYGTKLRRCHAMYWLCCGLPRSVLRFSAGPNLTSSRHRQRLASPAVAADKATCVGGQNVIPASSFHPFLQRDFPDKSPTLLIVSRIKQRSHRSLRFTITYPTVVVSELHVFVVSS